jgi:hypothetical protein
MSCTSIWSRAWRIAVAFLAISLRSSMLLVAAQVCDAESKFAADGRAITEIKKRGGQIRDKTCELLQQTVVSS